MKPLLLILFLSLGIPVLLFNCSSGEGTPSSDTTQQKDSTAVTTDAAPQKSKGKSPRSRAGKWKGKANREGKVTDDNSVPVEVTTVTRGDIANFLLFSSTLETEQTVQVFARVSGLVEAIYVDEGDRVKKGDKLLQIEKNEFELAEQKAQVEYQKQKNNFERLKALEEQELLSVEEYENARLALKQAEIAWKQAALNLEYTTVTAPITGVVGDRNVNVGERVQTSTVLFSLANLDKKIVRVYVPQDEFTKCYKRQPAVITTDVLPGKKFSGYVKRISPVIDPESGTFKVTIAVTDPQNRLRPGMFVNAELIVDTHTDTPLIPKSALIYENERTYFFIVTSDSAMKVELKKGFEDAEKVEVMNELPDSAKVVVLGQNGLKDGTRVKIIEEREYPWQTASSGERISMANMRQKKSNSP